MIASVGKKAVARGARFGATRAAAALALMAGSAVALAQRPTHFGQLEPLHQGPRPKWLLGPRATARLARGRPVTFNVGPSTAFRAWRAFIKLNRMACAGSATDLARMLKGKRVKGVHIVKQPFWKIALALGRQTGTQLQFAGPNRIRLLQLIKNRDHPAPGATLARTAAGPLELGLSVGRPWAPVGMPRKSGRRSQQMEFSISALPEPWLHLMTFAAVRITTAVTANGHKLRSPWQKFSWQCGVKALRYPPTLPGFAPSLPGLFTYSLPGDFTLLASSPPPKKIALLRGLVRVVVATDPKTVTFKIPQNQPFSPMKIKIPRYAIMLTACGHGMYGARSLAIGLEINYTSRDHNAGRPPNFDPVWNSLSSVPVITAIDTKGHQTPPGAFQIFDSSGGPQMNTGLSATCAKLPAGFTKVRKIDLTYFSRAADLRVPFIFKNVLLPASK